MERYVCMHCRRELYKENEEEKNCEHHPEAPVERVYVPDEVEE
jgi:hypothetical protein